MVWVLVFGGIAVAGVVTVASYGLWLWHKTSDVFAELEMLGKRAEELAALLEQVHPELPVRKES
jgi:hypothetical protein